MTGILDRLVISPQDLRVDHRTGHPVVDGTAPLLSWLRSPSQDGARTQIRISRLADDGSGGDDVVWEAILDGESAVRYAGRELLADSVYRWSCRVGAAHGHWSEWSAPALFSTGLQGRWVAPFISAPPVVLLHRGSQRVSYWHKVLRLSERPTRATVYATALGVYELRVNGRRVELGEQAPGWTSYEHRLHYQVAPITDLLVQGENELVAVVGPGWWAGHVGWFGSEIYGDRTAISVDLRLHGPGVHASAATDDTWRLTEGPVLFSDLIHGEDHDLTVADPAPGRRPDGPRAVVMPRPEVIFEVQPFSAMTAQELVRPIAVEHRDSHRVIVDFGQHLSGRVELQVGAEGAAALVIVRHADALTAAGELYTANLRTARQQDRFQTKAHAAQVLRPLFAQHGFRFAEISSEKPLAVGAETIRARVVHTAMAPSGTFLTSNRLLDRIDHNVRWSQKGNFLGVPVDCPQRDERLGWTGDLHLFAATALLYYDCAPMLESWLTTLIDDQRDDGAIRDIAPYPHLDPPPRDIQTGQPGWGDAIVGVPWEIYLRTGRLEILRRCWAPILRWLDYLQRRDPDSQLRSADVYGDWNSLEPTAPVLVGTGWYARSVRTATRMAEVLGDDAAALRLRTWWTDIAAEFAAVFVRPDGSVAGHSQTGYVVALANDLVPPNLVPAAVEHLAGLIRSRDHHLTTGFVGTAFVLQVLADHGHIELAYAVLLQDTSPSWGEQIRNGATTMWEHWDTWRPPDSFQNPAMNSFNHFALATVGQFLYEGVAGINADDARPGYRHVHFRPHPVQAVGAAGATLSTPGGAVASWWRIDEHQCFLKFVVPSTATVHLPRLFGRPAGAFELGPGIHHFIVNADRMERFTGDGSCVPPDSARA